MRVRVGTSGYAYKEWKGPFYPAKLPAAEFLRFYASKLETVEINNSFYRMPTEKVILDWGASVGDEFMFSIKAPQKITHMLKLANAEDVVAAFLRNVSVLDTKLGPLIFQLPPFLKKDLARFDAFATLLPSTMRIAFEFRHPSWFEDDAIDRLRARKIALCAAESDELASPVIATADWGYMRLRRTDYTDDELAAWADKILAQPWKEAFVYMKHDDGHAPDLAEKLRNLFRARG
jgi:uncharacterized protein YecE (DUF72 family)